MRRFDVVSTISQRMYQRLLDKGLPASKARMAVNWVDLAAFSTPGPGFDYRAHLGLAPDAVVALYSGNMGTKQGLEVLADVARLCLPNRAVAPMHQAQGASIFESDSGAGGQIEFVFCGSAGAGRSRLQGLCQGLSNVRFLDLQPPERLADFLRMANIHLLPQRADAADLVMPSKLTGMLASARPVVATAHHGTELEAVVNGCGLVVEPEDPTALARAVQQLAADPALRARLGAAGQAYAHANLDRDAVLQKFEADLFELVGVRPS
jgi:colanic acid biosynthesis glycosyl transferase WcaI